MNLGMVAWLKKRETFSLFFSFKFFLFIQSSDAYSSSCSSRSFIRTEVFDGNFDYLLQQK